MPTFTFNLMTLFRQRKTVYFNHVIQHAGKNSDGFTEGLPIEVSVSVKGSFNKACKVDGAKQTTAVRRQWLLTARVGCTNVFAKPVVVHLIDLVDQYKTRFRKIIGRGHDHVPEALGFYGLAHFTGDKACIIRDVLCFCRKLAPEHLRGIIQIQLIRFEFTLRDWKR